MSPTRPTTSTWFRPRGAWFASVLIACVLTFHAVVPNRFGRLGSLLETFLPWLGLAVPVLAGVALVRRSPVALTAVLPPLAAWLALFGGLLLPRSDGAYDLTAVQHNVSDVNPDPAGTARTLLSADADLIALEEVTPSHAREFTAALDYPHHAVVGTVGLWSRYPLTDVRAVDIRPADLGADWNRGLRATAATPSGAVAVFVAHLPSVRLGPGFGTARRDESAVLLGRALDAEPLPDVILLGDLNGTVDDRGLDPVRAQVSAPREGLAFSWPASFPLARIDQILARDAVVTRIWTLPDTGSDHVPVAARVRL
ncbi:endonuclease/exonuclease/phosphatase family protein [Streptomyces sp. NPDC051954]|uniref:endonuclease/exonuclease/phosphatase family protein n=1 Tax=unclassified Streptomyces TaxID=2593676 RepID=UPI0034198D07